MRLCLLSLAHLLMLVAVADVVLGNYLTLLLKNASSRANAANQIATVNKVKYNVKPAGGNKIYSTSASLQEQGPKNFRRPWIRISQYPPDFMEVAVGSRVVLICEASGNPPPQVYWLTEDESEEQELIRRSLVTSDMSTQWKGLGQVFATYVIDCVQPEDQGSKYCISLSKNNQIQTTVAATMLLVNSTKVAECNAESPPTITLYHAWRMALMGTSIILPCRVVGQPAPYLFWIDNFGKTITLPTHTRHTVLPNGDLQITDIIWEDMGDYTCKVQSGHTEKNVTTFLYPIHSDEMEE